LLVFFRETGVDGAFLFWKCCCAGAVRPIVPKLDRTVDEDDCYDLVEFGDDRLTDCGTAAIGRAVDGA
jgi:hypothetical protein